MTSYLSSVSIDEDVTAVEISVDDTRFVGVKIVQSLEYLLRPLLQGLNRHMTMLFPVIAQVPRCAHLRNEIQHIMFVILPNIVANNDILVVQ